MNSQEFEAKLGEVVNDFQRAGMLQVVQGIALAVLFSHEIEDQELEVLVRALALLPVMKSHLTNEQMAAKIRATFVTSPEVEAVVIETVKKLLKEGY